MRLSIFCTVIRCVSCTSSPLHNVKLAQCEKHSCFQIFLVSAPQVANSHNFNPLATLQQLMSMQRYNVDVKLHIYSMLVCNRVFYIILRVWHIISDVYFTACTKKENHPFDESLAAE